MPRESPLATTQEASDRIDRRSLGIALAGSLLVALGFAVGLYHAGFYSISADDSTRTLHALGNVQPDMVWLPLLRWIDHAALAVDRDPILVPRVVSCLAGLMTIPAIVILARQLGGGTAECVLTAALAAICADRIVLAQVPMPEILYIDFVVVATTAHVRAARRDDPRFLLVAALALAGAAALRYEAWLFVAAFAVALWLPRADRNPPGAARFRLAALTLAVAFPAAWTVIAVLRSGWPPAFVGTTAATFAAQYGPGLMPRVARSPAIQTALGGAWSLAFVGLTSLRASLRASARERSAIVAPIVALGVLTVLAVLGSGLPTHNAWRIGSVWLVLATPFVARSLWAMSARVPRRAVLVALAIGVASGSRLAWLTRASYLHADDLPAGRALAQVLDEDPRCRVLVDTHDYSFVNLMVTIPDSSRVLVDGGWGVRHDDARMIEPGYPIDASRLDRAGICALAIETPGRGARRIEWTVDPPLMLLFASPHWQIYRVQRAVALQWSATALDGLTGGETRRETADLRTPRVASPSN